MTAMEIGPIALSVARVDHGVEAASLQSLARPPATAADAPHPADTALPTATNALSEFALPAAQLVPGTLIGLQVEAAFAWPLPRRTEPQESAEPADEPPAPRGDDESRGDDAAHPDEMPPAAEHDACDLVFDDAAGNDWCEPLTRSLHAALAARIPPQALLAAADQWRRGRCVVLACPQGADPAGPAWAFVLWPHARMLAACRRSAQDKPPPLALVGLRVEARLQWSTLPADASWCHVRVVKEHHPRRGRQLVSLGADAQAPLACEVQLGPVLARSLHWCQVCLRINAVRRFWAALGAQWSVHVVVCAQPLAGVRTPAMEEASC
jgi:hypothetical protein